MKREQIKDTIYEDFVHAQIIRLYLFPEQPGDEPPHPWDYYPELFREEKERYLEYKDQKDLEDLKKSRMTYYKEFNDRIGRR